jgi:hypothetical protein
MLEVRKSFCCDDLQTRGILEVFCTELGGAAVAATSAWSCMWPTTSILYNARMQDKDVRQRRVERSGDLRRKGG